MLEALVEGKATAAEVAQLAVKSVRRKIPLLEAALEGHRLTDTLRFLIAQDMRHMEFLETEIAALDEQIAEQLQPFAKQVELLGSLPGIDRVTAATILGHWRGYDPLSDCSPTGFLGGTVSGQLRERRHP
jgi:transposase